MFTAFITYLLYIIKSNQTFESKTRSCSYCFTSICAYFSEVVFSPVIPQRTILRKTSSSATSINTCWSAEKYLWGQALTNKHNDKNFLNVQPTDGANPILHLTDVFKSSHTQSQYAKGNTGNGCLYLENENVLNVFLDQCHNMFFLVFPLRNLECWDYHQVVVQATNKIHTSHCTRRINIHCFCTNLKIVVSCVNIKSKRTCRCENEWLYELNQLKVCCFKTAKTLQLHMCTKNKKKCKAVLWSGSTSSTYVFTYTWTYRNDTVQVSDPFKNKKPIV